MKKLFASLALLALLVTPARVAATAADDLSQLRALEATFAAAYNDKDVATLMSVYARGSSLFVFDVVGPPGVYRSWDAYRDAWKHFFAMFKGRLRFNVGGLDVEASGDVAYSRSIQHVSGTRVNGKPYDITVRVTDVYRKIGGKWLIVQEHVSLPLDRRTFTPLLRSPP